MRWVAFLALVSCTDRHDHRYHWDDQRILCSASFDDYLKPINWDHVERDISDAGEDGRVVLMHAHDPGATVTADTIDRLLTLSESYGLDYITYSDLFASTPARPGIAIAFDDHTVADWYAQRELFTRHGARLTFFVTYLDRMSPSELDMLATLAGDGHTLEAHSVNHLEAPAYVEEHGAQAYVNDEVLPSIAGLEQLGYPVTTYAYPYGEGVDAVTTILLGVVDRVRVGIGSCPP